MKKTLLLALILLIMSVMMSEKAWPHTLDNVGISARYEANTIELIANVSIKTLANIDGMPFLDINKNGVISQSEVTHFQRTLKEYVSRGILLLNQESEPPTLLDVRMDSLNENFDGLIIDSGNESGRDYSAQAVSYIKFSLNYAWQNEPQTIDLRYGLLDTEKPIHIQMIDGLNKRFETADLGGESNTIRLKSEYQNPSNNRLEATTQTDRQSVWMIGILHVLTGADHVLFILSLALVVRHFKALVWPLTSFTLCHSFTLAFIAQGGSLDIPSWTIELAIAASIILILLYETLGKGIQHLSWVSAGLGIIHGLGFAQALTDTLGDLSVWANTLIKLTIGIELTQLIIAFLGLFALKLLSILVPKKYEQLRLLWACMMGLFACMWLYQRIITVF